MFARYIHFFKNILSKIGLNDNISNFIAEAISFVTLILVTILIYYAVVFIIRKTLNAFIEKTPSKRDDILLKNKVFKRLCLLIPA